MRILHTADWHLGRSFHGVSLLEHQAAFCAWLRDVAVEGEVDAIVVAGDLYDRALAPVDAVRLADEALASLCEVAPVVVISGNHDSPTRLGFGARLLQRAGLHLRADVAAVGTPVLVGDGALAVYAIPYLEPDVARPILGVEERGHAAVLGAAMARVRADLARRPGVASVVCAHALLAGAASSGSERELSVGGASAVGAAVFSGVDYAALGHLHGPQRAGANGRYAGSPLAFGFSEARDAKSVALVEVGGDVELVACPVPRPLAVLRGRLEDLLTEPGLASAQAAWVSATLTDAARPADAMERLRARFAHVVALSFEPEGATAAQGSYAARLRGLDDAALAGAFVADVRGTEADAGEQALLAEALDAGAARAAEIEVAA